MGCFLLNELGEVLLELKSNLYFGEDMLLEVNEAEQTAVLKSKGESFDVGFLHNELIFPLKMRRYLFVVERNNEFYIRHSALAKVVFVG